MSEVNLSSRFQPRENVPVLPGCCFICRGTNGPYIDTSASVAWEGAIYICQACVVEMYRQLGLDVPVNEEEIVAREAAAFAAGAELGSTQIRAAFDAFVADFNSRANAITAPDVPHSVEDSFGGTESAGKSKSRSRKSDSSGVEVDSADSVAGRDDVPADSTNGESDLSGILSV